jgi:Domain of unknown function (DUF5659)
MYSTTQLALAAYLLTIGFELVDCAPANRKQAQFFFKDPERKASQEAHAYDHGAVCEARALYANFRTLRRMADEAVRRG